jgi:GTPase SAR1 family protein
VLAIELICMFLLLQIVYDITDMDSFDHVKHWLTEIERYTSDNVNMILVGNKCDLAEKRAVEQQMAKVYSKLFYCTLTIMENASRSGCKFLACEWITLCTSCTSCLTLLFSCF